MREEAVSVDSMAPLSPAQESDGVAAVLRYHARTKHHLGRYAPGPGHLDWASQPDAFRRYEGAPQVALRIPEPLDGAPPFGEVVEGSVAVQPLSERVVSQLLYDALAISAWKVAGDSRWAVRCNPSSGNLHPTEAYLILPAVPGMGQAAALYHYNVHDHALERLRDVPCPLWMDTVKGLPHDSFLLALTSVHWREAWKYGERAYRYCQHDVGHAVAQLSYAAAAMGWEVRMLPAVGDAAIAALTGADRQSGSDAEMAQEAEHPDVLLCVSPRSSVAQLPGLWHLGADLLQAWQALPLLGTPNRLGRVHRLWPEIERVAQAATRGYRATVQMMPRRTVLTLRQHARDEDERLTARSAGQETGARHLYRHRRSVVAMDGQSAMAHGDFLRLSARLLKQGGCPWNAFPWPAVIHPVFFVHRVEGVAPGAYLLIRHAARSRAIRSALTRFPEARRWDGWSGPGEVFQLAVGNLQGFAHNSNCMQEIASEGAFSVAMLADFKQVLEREGAWAYRRLFWEAGFLGQVLYLEAEASGLRGTGIGCFFDDMVHDALGLKDDSFQTLYGFTVGGALEDERVRSEPSYPARAEEQQP